MNWIYSWIQIGARVLDFFQTFASFLFDLLLKAIKVVQVGEEVCDILIIRRFLENVNNEFGSDETKFWK